MQYARLWENGTSGLYVFHESQYFAVKNRCGEHIDLPEGMAAGEDLTEWAEAALQGPPTQKYRFLPAVPPGGKLICVGTNYKKHLAEIKLPVPTSPVLFSKFDNALAAHGEEIALPACARQFDHEAELVLVIGKKGKLIPREEALSHIFGFTCGNDFSARDLQFQTSQWLVGKTADGFAPLGPNIGTIKGLDPDRLGIFLRVNGETRQKGNTGDMIFSCDELISYISQTITLLPGDVVFTGTPEGVIQGLPESERVWLKAGDRVEVEIEGLPPLSNTLK